jgi:tRNA(Arg) A34 adenosine deaminase TadA
VTDLRKYEAMRDAGATPQEICRYLRANNVGSVDIIKILRATFDLTLIEAKEVKVTADGRFASLDEYHQYLAPQIEQALEDLEMEEHHIPYIRECIRLAEEAKRNGNHPFGSILVHQDKILLRAQNAVNTYNDLSQHPESILAITAASKYDGDFLAEVTMYTSTEPCAMCSGAIYWSGIGRVVFAVSNAKMREFAPGGLSMTCRQVFESGTRLVEVIGPVLEDEAAQVHVGYWT